MQTSTTAKSDPNSANSDATAAAESSAVATESKTPRIMHRGDAKLGQMIWPPLPLCAYSMNGRASQDRFLIGAEINPKWTKLDSATKKAVIHSTIAKMQYLTWRVIYSLPDTLHNSSGACALFFVPGLLVGIGDCVATNLDTEEQLDIFPIPSLIPPHHIQANQKRLALDLSATRSIGDPFTAAGYNIKDEIKIAADPNFEMRPDIIEIGPHTNVMLASDALTELAYLLNAQSVKKKDSPITLREVKAIIRNSANQPGNMAKAIAADINPKRTDDDTTIVVFHSSLPKLIAVIDGHGRNKLTGHYTANTVKHNFCWLLDKEIEIFSLYGQLSQTHASPKDSKSSVSLSKKQFGTINPQLFGNWDYYRQTDEENKSEKKLDNTYAHFFKRFEELLALQIQTLEKTYQLSSQDSEQKMLADFTKLQLDSLIYFQKQIGQYIATKSYMTPQTRDESYLEPEAASTATAQASIYTGSSATLFASSSASSSTLSAPPSTAELVGSDTASAVNSTEIAATTSASTSTSGAVVTMQKKS